MATPVDLVPFNPPADYEFEAELRDEPPRARPAELSTCPLAIRRRRLVSGLLIAASACTAMAALPFVQECGLYLVPLQHLYWFGIGFGAAGLGKFAFDRVFRGPYRYVEEGRPLVARIRSVELRVYRKIHGSPASHCFHALLEFRHPESGELQTLGSSSREISDLELGAGLGTTYRVGDFATAVYFPGKVEKSLRLYGFLDLRPGLGLVAPEGALKWSPRVYAVILGLAFGPLILLLGHGYIASKYWPIDMDMVQMVAAFVAGAITLGGGFLAFLASRKGPDQTQPVESALWKRIRAVWAWFEGPLGTLCVVITTFTIGGLAVLCWCFAANAFLDPSPPRFRPVQIDRMTSQTHHGIIREYKIEYHFIDDNRSHHSIFSTPAEMARFRGPGDLAIAEVHAGRLGWPWTRAIRPRGKLP